MIRARLPSRLHLRLAWLDLVRHKGPTALVLLSLGLTVACAGILIRLGTLAQSRFGRMAHAGDALVGAKAGQVEMLLGCMNLEGPYPGFIPIRIYQTLLSQNKIGFADAEVNTRLHRVIVPIVFCGTFNGYRLIGTTKAFLHQPEPGPDASLAEGKWAGSDSEAEVVLGSEVAGRARLHVGEDIPVSTWTSNDAAEQSGIPVSLKVSGILSPMGNVWDRALFTGLGESKKILTAGMPRENTVWGKDVLHYLIVYLLPGGMEQLRTLINQRTVAQVVSVREAEETLENLTGSGRAVGAMVIALVLILGGLSMSGIMMSRFEAKSRHLALLQAMGFQRKDLRTLLVWEGLLLGLGSLMLGALIDGALFPFVRRLLGANLPSPREVPSALWQSWPVWAMALAAMLLSSLIPLFRFARTHPRETLRNLS